MGETKIRGTKPATAKARTTPASPEPKKRPAASVRKSVIFQIHAPEAKTVDIAGTFSSWTLKPMKRGKDGTWKATFRPQPGTHQYKFLVDHRWMEDPANHDKAHDGHGGFNSVRKVE